MTQLKSLTFGTTAGEVWYFFTEAWLMVTGGLTNENFSTSTTVVVDYQVDYSDKVHNHNGVLGNTIEPGVIQKEHFDPNALHALWTSMFSRGTNSYFLCGGETSVAATTLDTSYYYGYTAFNYNWSSGQTDLAGLSAAMTNPTCIGMIFSNPYLSSYAANQVYPPVLYGTGTTPTGVLVTTKLSTNTIIPMWIGLFRL